jgi:RNA polymerase sigma-70 factor (ECF subfamily)
VAEQIPTASKAKLDEEFTELYRAHLRDVYSYAYYRVGNHHDAEDLTEQTFLQAYRHFERALRESEGRPLRPWLIRIAHNLAANLYRDRSRRPAASIEDTDALSAPHTTESLVEGRDELSRVLAGVRRLPDDRREALIMRFALGMDNREIARALGRSDGATKVLIHRAIKQLEGLVADAPVGGSERDREDAIEGGADRGGEDTVVGADRGGEEIVGGAERDREDTVNEADR